MHITGVEPCDVPDVEDWIFRNFPSAHTVEVVDKDLTLLDWSTKRKKIAKRESQRLELQNGRLIRVNGTTRTVIPSIQPIVAIVKTPTTTAVITSNCVVEEPHSQWMKVELPTSDSSSSTNSPPAQDMTDDEEDEDAVDAIPESFLSDYFDEAAAFSDGDVKPDTAVVPPKRIKRGVMVAARLQSAIDSIAKFLQQPTNVSFKDVEVNSKDILAYNPLRARADSTSGPVLPDPDSFTFLNGKGVILAQTCRSAPYVLCDGSKRLRALQAAYPNGRVMTVRVAMGVDPIQWMLSSVSTPIAAQRYTVPDRVLHVQMIMERTQTSTEFVRNLSTKQRRVLFAPLPYEEYRDKILSAALLPDAITTPLAIFSAQLNGGPDSGAAAYAAVVRSFQINTEETMDAVLAAVASTTTTTNPVTSLVKKLRKLSPNVQQVLAQKGIGQDDIHAVCAKYGDDPRFPLFVRGVHCDVNRKYSVEWFDRRFEEYIGAHTTAASSPAPRDVSDAPSMCRCAIVDAVDATILDALDKEPNMLLVVFNDVYILEKLNSREYLQFVVITPSEILVNDLPTRTLQATVVLRRAGKEMKPQEIVKYCKAAACPLSSPATIETVFNLAKSFSHEWFVNLDAGAMYMLGDLPDDVQLSFNTRTPNIRVHRPSITASSKRPSKSH